MQTVQITQTHITHSDVPLLLQECLLQATYRFEPALTAFLEDAAVDLVACSIYTTSAGQKQLSISNVADFTRFYEFQVC